MTYKALTMVDWIKTAIIEAGVTDIVHSYSYRPQLKEFRRDMYDVDSERENKSRSALYFADKINKNTPILIFHGTKDDSVSPLDSLRLCEKLQTNGNQYELHIYKDLDHMIRSKDKWIQTKKWLKKYL
jgi:dipeptidyl aminopeptidase/acylaminoacyl peptidase